MLLKPKLKQLIAAKPIEHKKIKHTKIKKYSYCSFLEMVFNLYKATFFSNKIVLSVILYC